MDRALFAVIMTAYITGTSTRKVDDLVKALGCDSGISKSTVSRICKQIDETVGAFRTRRLDDTEFPYVFADATFVKGRVDGRVVSLAVVVAFGVNDQGTRELLGADVHLLRNVLAQCSKDTGETVTAVTRTILHQPHTKAVTAQLRAVVDQLEPTFPKVAAMLLDAETDLTAFATFPKPHWRRIWSTNRPERVNKEIKRRTKVVGIFPDDAAIIRLVGAVLLYVHDEWQVAERAYFSDASMKLIDTTTDDQEDPAELDAA